MATTTKKSTSKAKTKTTVKAKKPAVKKTTTKATKTTNNTTTKAAVIASEKTTKKVSTSKKPKTQLQQLRIWNLVIAFLSFAQGLAIILISNDQSFPVTTSFLTKDAIASTDSTTFVTSATRNLFDVNVVYLLAAIFFISALAHLSLATWYRKRYEASISVGLNRARWFAYGISMSLILATVAMLAGVTDLSTLLLVIGATMTMSLIGTIFEVHNQLTSKVSWLGYKVSALTAMLPWVVVGIYLWGANMYGDGGIESFVYWVVGSLFVLSGAIAVNIYLQYKKTGRWSDYFFGEKVYMALSVIFSAALAWQVYASLLS